MIGTSAIPLISIGLIYYEKYQIQPFNLKLSNFSPFQCKHLLSFFSSELDIVLRNTTFWELFFFYLQGVFYQQSRLLLVLQRNQYYHFLVHLYLRCFTLSLYELASAIVYECISSAVWVRFLAFRIGLLFAQLSYLTYIIEYIGVGFESKLFLEFHLGIGLYCKELAL